MPSDNHHTLSNLNRAIETFRDRNRTYGESYRNFGRMMTALYPSGFPGKGEVQMNRLGIIIHIVAKLSRYVANPLQGHRDSIHDLIVYSAMLEELDADAEGLNTATPLPAAEPSGQPRHPADFNCEHVYHGGFCRACGALDPNFQFFLNFKTDSVL